jgi:hypothetical protein
MIVLASALAWPVAIFAIACLAAYCLLRWLNRRDIDIDRLVAELKDRDAQWTDKFARLVAAQQATDRKVDGLNPDKFQPLGKAYDPRARS